MTPLGGAGLQTYFAGIDSEMEKWYPYREHVHKKERCFMKKLYIEKITKDWEKKQRHLLKAPENDYEKVVNKKRSQRFGHTYENKMFTKYGVQSVLCELSR